MEKFLAANSCFTSVIVCSDSVNIDYNYWPGCKSVMCVLLTG